MEDLIIILMTASSIEEADLISNSLLEKKLIACSNIINDMKSTFWWNGNIQKENEVLIIAKSTKALLDNIITEVRSIHSYDVPEILAIPILGGNPDYLDWITEATKSE